MGLPWTTRRVWYEMRRRSGLLARRFPATPWDAETADHILLPDVPREAPSYDAWRRAHRIPTPVAAAAARADLLRATRGEQEADTQARALGLAGGTLRYFGFHDLGIGSPPRWHRDPWLERDLPSDLHWTAIPDFGDGDIKCVWEASRGTWAVHLARAYATSRDERWPALFWMWVEDWVAKNPPNLGPNWMCGQETSFRAIAWAWAAEVFADSPATTPARRLLLTRVLHRLGNRIAANISYAMQQKNNHGLSEPTGLLTIGLLHPELRDSARWVAMGRRYLERELARQIYDDGSYVQHSVNYHRLMLQVATWALALCDAAGAPLSDPTRARVAQAAWWLYGIQDETTGGAPRYGANDGAHVFPLAETASSDFRPAVAAALSVAVGARPYGPGPWDEESLWLAGPQALLLPATPTPRGSVGFASGGYYTLRGKESFAFLRCTALRDRPGHADQLHLDVWWRGWNVVRDPGTFAYHAGDPWMTALIGTPAHSTAQFDDLNQMRRASRFLWTGWSEGRVRRRVVRDGGAWELLETELPHYPAAHGPARQRRAVLRLGGALYLVVDDLSASAAATAQLHWLLPDVTLESSDRAATLHLGAERFTVAWDAGPGNATHWVSGDRADPVHGWEAPHYRHIVPARSLVITLPLHPAARVVTAFGPGVQAVELDANRTAARVRTVDGDVWLALGAVGRDAQVIGVRTKEGGAEDAWTP
jgi:hypothetical protein